MSDLTREETIILLDEIRKILLKNPSWDESTHEPINQTFDMAIKALENQKTGHWIWEEKIVSETYTDPKEIDYIGWVCDNCHNPPNDYAEWDNPEEKPMYKFCPNCGAKMEK